MPAMPGTGQQDGPVQLTDRSKGRHVIGSRGSASLMLSGVCAFALVACSGTGAPSAPASGPVTAAPRPTPGTSRADTAKTDALAAYRGMWADFVAAGVTSDWQATRLGDHATGVALTNLSRGLYADRRNGLVTKGEPALDPAASSAEPATDPTKVVVTDCGDSSMWLKYRSADGALADDSPGGRQSISAIVEKQSDEAWKVTDFGVGAVGSC